jgi:uncharacterized repeat protein (TIGR03943 family)
MGLYRLNNLKKTIGFVGQHLQVLMVTAILAGLIWLLVNRNYTAFLHPRFWPFLLSGAVILCGFILAFIFAGRRPFAGPWPAVLIRSAVMLVPLLFMIAVAGQGMGTHALTRKYTGTEQELLSSLMAGKDDLTEPQDLNRTLSLLDIVRKMDSLDGRPVSTEGLVYRDVNVPADYLLLFRFAIFCCAADAIPVWVVVKEDMAALENETWVRIDGTFKVARMHGRDVPLIRADAITKLATPPPGARYLYF